MTDADAGTTEIWFNPSCSKCRAAQEMFDDAGSGYVLRRYLEDPPTAAELDRVLTRLDLQPWDVTRLADDLAKELDLASAPRDRAAWIDLLVRHPALLQRPIVLTADGGAWVARDPASVQQAISSAAGGADRT